MCCAKSLNDLCILCSAGRPLHCSVTLLLQRMIFVILYSRSLQQLDFCLQQLPLVMGSLLWPIFCRCVPLKTLSLVNLYTSAISCLDLFSSIVSSFRLLTYLAVNCSSGQRGQNQSIAFLFCVHFLAIRMLSCQGIG